MKIIGEDKDNLIVLMSKDEAANYSGEYSAYHMREKLMPGSKVDMSAIYKEAREAIEDFDKIKKSVDELHKAALRVITKLDISKKEKGN